jgi:hypothetical protein
MADGLLSILREKRARFQTLGSGDVLDLNIDDACVNWLEDQSSSDATAAHYLSLLTTDLNAIVDPDDKVTFETLFSDYGEALVYWQFCMRGFPMRRIEESRDQGVKTPDFSLSLTACDFFVEVKTPTIVTTDPRIERLTTAREQQTYDKLRIRIDLEERAQVPGLYFSETITDGFRAAINRPPAVNPGTIEKELSRAELIGLFIRKVRGMVKSQQFDHGPTF